MPHTNTVPKEEEAVYAALSDMRQKLSALKKDRSQYLNSKDVLTMYSEVRALYKELASIRGTVQPRSHLPNKVDQVLDDVFQLLSLFFITVGLTKTAPATYASLTTVQRLLEHLNESAVYTKHDLQPIQDRLKEINTIISENKVEEDEDFILKAKLADCLDEYKQVEAKVEDVDPSLQSLLEHLISLRRKLLSMASRPDYDKKLLVKIELELHELETHRDSTGKFQSLESGKVEAGNGQSVLNGLLDDCHTLIADLHAHSFKLDESLLPIYNRLISLKSTLEDLLVTRRWTLRETDLYTYQKDLQELDDLRVHGKFPTNSVSDSKGQSVLLYLLRRCYAIIYKLLESSEPVSEALQPIHNQLSTVRRCLLEVKRMGGINSPRELYPYQMKLASLDNLREDGKFIVDGQIPEGQGTLNALLAECYDICQEMKIEAEDNDKSMDDDAETQNPYENDDDDEEGEDDEDGEEAEDTAFEDDYPASYAPSIADSEAV